MPIATPHIDLPGTNKAQGYGKPKTLDDNYLELSDLNDCPTSPASAGDDHCWIEKDEITPQAARPW